MSARAMRFAMLAIALSVPAAAWSQAGADTGKNRPATKNVAPPTKQGTAAPVTQAPPKIVAPVTQQSKTAAPPPVTQQKTTTPPPVTQQKTAAPAPTTAQQKAAQTNPPKTVAPQTTQQKAATPAASQQQKAATPPASQQQKAATPPANQQKTAPQSKTTPAPQQNKTAPPATKGAAASTTGQPAPGAGRGANPQVPAPRDTVIPTALMREVFDYSRDGRRDPFISLLTTTDLRPALSDLKLLMTVIDEPGRSVALVSNAFDKKNPQKTLRVGDRLGRMRVSSIRSDAVIFTIEEFGMNRRDSLLLRDPSKTGVGR
jgi:hypothetical protein